MEETGQWLFVSLTILSIWFWRDHHKLTAQIQTLQDEVYELNYKVNSLSDALEQTNLNIEGAKIYAWSSYEDMGYALDNLETVEP